MKFIFFYCILFCSTSLLAHEINIDGSFSHHKIRLSEIYIYEDSTNLYNPTHWNELIEDIYLYKPYDKNIRLSRSTWWGKIAINNATNNQLKLYLYTDYTPLEYVKLYQQNFNNHLIEDSVGCKISFSQRKVSTNLLVFEVFCNPGLNYLFLKVKSPYVKFPFILGTQEELIRTQQNQTMYYSWVVGIIFVIALATLVAFFYFRNDYFYLKYFVYLCMLLMLIITYVGYAFQFFWPESEIWNSKSYMIFSLLMASFHLLFAIDLLKLERYSLLLKNMMAWLSFAFMIIACLVVFLDTTTSLWITLPVMFAMLPVTVIIIYYPIKEKSSIAYSYASGFAVFLLPTSLTVFKDTGVLFFNDGINVHIFTGMVIEIIFFTIALGFRIKDKLEKISINNRESCDNNVCKNEYVVLDILTKKENEIFNYAGQLLNDVEIAEKAGTTTHTVRYHLKNIYAKLELKNRIMLIQKYEEVKKMQRGESKMEV
ncbi:MAG TPA: 7TM diverse intracellular signaling domain-containing protein [Cytophagaceae bacterium]